MTVAEPTTTSPGPMVPLMYRVATRREEMADTVTLDLVPVDQGIARPLVGQFTMLWAFGIGEAPISLAGFDDGVLTHTVRSVGAVTAALFEAAEGVQIGVRGPYGTGWDLERARGRDVLIVAGGLGLAPVRPVVAEVLSRREDFGRAVLLVGARTPDALLYRSELEDWRGRFDIEVEVTVDSASPSWRGDVGVVTRLIDRAPVDPAQTTAFVCGPEVMMRFCAQALLDRGVSPAELTVSLERNMQCAVGHCGHCQLGPHFVCLAGPVLAWPEAGPLLRIKER